MDLKKRKNFYKRYANMLIRIKNLAKNFIFIKNWRSKEIT